MGGSRPGKTKGGWGSQGRSLPDRRLLTLGRGRKRPGGLRVIRKGELRGVSLERGWENALPVKVAQAS